MNKRQRRKTEKKLRDFIDKKKLERMEIEVGDTVEIVGRRYGGYETGGLALVVTPPPRQGNGLAGYDLCVSIDMKPYDEYAMIHHREDLKLIKKGTSK